MTNNLKPLNNQQKKTDLETQINTLDLPNQLNLVLTAPWEKRFEIISSSEQAGQIVANMPVEELFWTIKATGIEDSSIILSLATPEQLQFIFDLDWWHKDRLKSEKIAAWLLVMFELSVQGLRNWLKWILNRDPWLFPAILNEFITVVKRPDEMDIQEAKDRLPAFTLDNVYFIDFKKKKLAPLFIRLITDMVEMDAGKYRDILETMLWETPSHNLETAYRLRCGRIGDFGVPDYYQSLDIYVPISKEEMHVIELHNSPLARLPVNYDMPAFVPTLYVSGYPALENAVRMLAGNPVMERIVRETTGVANKILMADLVDLDEPENLKMALEKAFSLINLGIEKLSELSGKAPEEILKSHYLEEIARFSSGLLLPFGDKARKITSGPYYKVLPHRLKDVVEAASLRPSMLFDISTGLPKSVKHLDELKRLEFLLSEASAWSKVVPFLEPSFEKWPSKIKWEETNFLAPEEFSVDSALATAVSHLITKSRFQVTPLDREELEALYERLSGMGKEETFGLLKELLEPLCAKDDSGLKEEELSETILPYLLEVFSELVTEGERAINEPQYIKHILVKT